MSDEIVQKDVRIRERFLCANCRQHAGEQYAHIIPESEGGGYSLDNLLFLCWHCHNQLEAAKTNAILKKRLITLAEQLRDAPKRDGVLQAVFSFVGNNYPVISLGGGIKIINLSPVLEKYGQPKHPYLKLAMDERGLLYINAYFEDTKGQIIMSIENNKLTLDTKDAWDVVFRRRYIRFESKQQEVYLEVSQSDTLDLVVTGKLYLNGGLFDITSTGISDLSSYNFIAGNSSIFNGHGVLLRPSTCIF